jgi:acid stress-induced BolA-like protein IbaG/YrbA
MQPEEIRRLIEAGLANSEAHVEGDGAHFTAIVVCPAFVGKSRLQKQQLVYDTVRAQLLDGTLHALSIKAFTPEEWEKLEQQLNSDGKE